MSRGVVFSWIHFLNDCQGENFIHETFHAKCSTSRNLVKCKGPRQRQKNQASQVVLNLAAMELFPWAMELKSNLLAKTQCYRTLPLLSPNAPSTCMLIRALKQRKRAKKRRSKNNLCISSKVVEGEESHKASPCKGSGWTVACSTHLKVEGVET